MLSTTLDKHQRVADCHRQHSRIYSIGRRSFHRLLLVAIASIATGALTPLLPLQAQSAGRWLEVERLAGDVTVQMSPERPAQIGDRLSEPGHGLTTRQQSSAHLKLDYTIGTVAVAQNTRLLVQRLATLADGARVTVLEVESGQARIQARPFTNPNTVLELHTPSGVAAVRGTEFGIAVTEAGKTSIGTLEGSVEATAESITVDVDAGLASIIRPGEPPTAPTPLDRQLDITWLNQTRRGNRLFVSGRVDPTNSVFVGEEEITVSPRGTFEWSGNQAVPNRSLIVTVKNPLGEARQHPLLTWQIRDLDP